MPLSQARVFYDSIFNEEPPARFAKLCAIATATPPTAETEWLEFKHGMNVEFEEPAIKQKWSEVLSGFANTQGGVLIWGVTADCDPVTRIDAASGIALAPNVHRLRSRLMELHLPATDPPVQGVEVEAIEDPSQPGRGFVICYVPESAARPHRAEFASRQFYIRAGDDFTVASVSLLRLLFFPQARARLVPRVTIRHIQSAVVFDFSLKNRGTATASDVLIVIAAERLHGTIDHYEHVSVSTSGSPYNVRFKEPIHPGLRTTALVLTCSLHSNSFSEPAVFSVSTFSHGAEPLRWGFVISPADIEKRAVVEATDSKSLLFDVV